MTRIWPPLIVAANAPVWMRRRDFVLTLAMWLLLAFTLERQFKLVAGPYLERWGWGDFDIDPQWEVLFRQLQPFLEVTAVLVALLTISGLFTLQRRRRALLGAQPPPVTPEEQAARAGLEPNILLAGRELPNVVVSLEPDGSCSIKPR